MSNLLHEPHVREPVVGAVPSGPVDTSGTVSDESPRFNVILPAEPPQPASSAMETTSATAARAVGAAGGPRRRCSFGGHGS
ncbi:MAG: hypothetical protein V9G12_12680 [Microthrixaceae bacterium]